METILGTTDTYFVLRSDDALIFPTILPLHVFTIDV